MVQSTKAFDATEVQNPLENVPEMYSLLSSEHSFIFTQWQFAI